MGRDVGDDDMTRDGWDVLDEGDEFDWSDHLGELSGKIEELASELEGSRIDAGDKALISELREGLAKLREVERDEGLAEDCRTIHRMVAVLDRVDRGSGPSAGGWAQPLGKCRELLEDAADRLGCA